MACAPASSVLVVKVALPLAPSGAVPSVFVPSRKVTVPVADAPATVAVKVTVWPVDDGLGDATTVVVDVALPVVRFAAAEVLAANVLLPEYTAVTECAPTASVVVLKLALPLASSWA